MTHLLQKGHTYLNRATPSNSATPWAEHIQTCTVLKLPNSSPVTHFHWQGAREWEASHSKHLILLLLPILPGLPTLLSLLPAVCERSAVLTASLPAAALSYRDGDGYHPSGAIASEKPFLL